MKRVRDCGGLMRDCGNDTEVYGTIINVPLIFFDFSTIRVGKCLWKKNLKIFIKLFPHGYRVNVMSRTFTNNSRHLIVGEVSI